jgi:hypothetical protein
MEAAGIMDGHYGGRRFYGGGGLGFGGYYGGTSIPTVLVATTVGRICGDTDTEWDRERETWLCSTHRREINR